MNLLMCFDAFYESDVLAMQRVLLVSVFGCVLVSRGSCFHFDACRPPWTWSSPVTGTWDQEKTGTS